MVFAITAVLLIGAIVLSSCLKEVPLRLMSGNQARAQASESETAVAPVVAPAESVSVSVDAVRVSAVGDSANGASDDNTGRPRA